MPFEVANPFANLAQINMWKKEQERQSQMDQMAHEQNQLAMLLQRAQLDEYNRKRQLDDETRGVYRQAYSSFGEDGQPSFPMARPGLTRESFLRGELGRVGNVDLLRQIEAENEARGDKNLSLLFQAAKENSPSYKDIGGDMYQLPGDPTLLQLLQSRGVTMPQQPSGVSLPALPGVGVGQGGMPQSTPATGPRKVVGGRRKLDKTVDLGNAVEYIYSDGTSERKAKGRLPGSGGHGEGGPSKPPAGYRWTPDGNLEAIPGGPAGKLSPEQAAKVQLVQQGQRNAAEFAQMLFPDGKNVDRTLLATMAVRAPGTDGRTAYSLVYDAIEAKLRAESGAAVPESEVQRMSKRLVPSVMDNDETIRTKMRMLDAFLQGADTQMGKGRGGSTGGWGVSTPTSSPLSGNNRQMGRPRTANDYLKKW